MAEKNTLLESVGSGGGGSRASLKAGAGLGAAMMAAPPSGVSGTGLGASRVPGTEAGTQSATAPAPSCSASALRVSKTLKREAESLWDVPPDTYGSRACARLSVPAQLVAVAVLGSFQFGYNLAALNTSKAFVVLDFAWCREAPGPHSYIGCEKGLLYGSLVTTAVFVGAAVGCLVGGRITDFGRRMALLGTHCLLMLGCGLSSGAEGFVSLFLARLVVGVAVGLFTVVVPMYIAEVTPESSRGFFGTFHQLMITVGIFFGTVLGLAFGQAPEENVVYQISTFQQAWWRILLGFPLIVSFIAVLLYLWVFPFETPQYMIEKRQRVKAAALLREIYGREDVDTEMHRLLQGHYEIKIQRAQQLSLWKAIAHHSAYRHVIIIACLLSMFQQFSGINVLVANSNNLYVSLKLPSSTITGLTVGFAALNVILTVVTVPLVDTLGRRTLLLFSLIVQFAAMAVAFVANLIDRSNTAVQWTTVACVYVFIVGFAVGYGPVLWIYLHEIFPPEIKQGAAGLASALNWVATVIIVLPSDFLLNSSFTVFVGICTGALLFILIVAVFFVKETKGLPIEESPYFKGKHRAVSGNAVADKFNPSFFYASQQQRSTEDATAGFPHATPTVGVGNAVGGGAGITSSGAHPVNTNKTVGGDTPRLNTHSNGSSSNENTTSGSSANMRCELTPGGGIGGMDGRLQQQQKRQNMDGAVTSVPPSAVRVPGSNADVNTSGRGGSVSATGGGVPVNIRGVGMGNPQLDAYV